MTKITVYDDTEKEIDKLAMDNGVTDAQIIDALLEAVQDHAIDLADYI